MTFQTLFMEVLIMLDLYDGNSLSGNVYYRETGISAVQKVYKDIRYQILNLILEPGTTISKNKIAKQYGNSPTPVREAMLRLGEEGLVNIFPQSRTSVSLIDIQHARVFIF